MAIERERRFLLRALPPYECVEKTMIRQAYWRLGHGWFLRIRREGAPDGPTTNSVTMKGPRDGLGRPEFDVVRPHDASSAVEDDAEEGTYLTEAQAAELFNGASKHRVVKYRYSYIIDGMMWDIDEFIFENEGLFIAELEMQDATVLGAVPMPVWADREVTNDLRYANDSLAFEPYSEW